MGAGCYRGIGESTYVGDTGRAARPGQRWRRRGGVRMLGYGLLGHTNTGMGGRSDATFEACTAQWSAGAC
jgi:hypothetical protein